MLHYLHWRSPRPSPIHTFVSSLLLAERKWGQDPQDAPYGVPEDVGYLDVDPSPVDVQVAVEPDDKVRRVVVRPVVVVRVLCVLPLHSRHVGPEVVDGCCFQFEPTGCPICLSIWVGLTRIWLFHCSLILPSCPAASAKFPSGQFESGRQWNIEVGVNPTEVHEQMGHPVPCSLDPIFYHRCATYFRLSIPRGGEGAARQERASTSATSLKKI